MPQPELRPFSDLSAEEIFAKESALADYNGKDRVDKSDVLRDQFGKEQRKVFSFATGLSRLDAAIGNLETGELIAIGGPTKNGKTTLCQTWTINLSKQGVGCLWFSFEVPMRQFLDQIPQATEFYVPMALRFSDKNWLRDRILEGKLKFNTRVVFVDNLHHLVDFQSLRNTSLDIGVVIRDLKRMAVELNVVIVVLCHSKKGEHINGEPKEVSEWDLRDSSFIPQESDSTIMVQRKLNDQNQVSSEAIIKVCLHRRKGTMNKIIHVIKAGGEIIEDERYYTTHVD